MKNCFQKNEYRWIIMYRHFYQYWWRSTVVRGQTLSDLVVVAVAAVGKREVESHVETTFTAKNYLRSSRRYAN